MMGPRGQGRLRRRLAALDQTLTAQPGHALVGMLRIPESRVSPARAIIMRVVYALAALFAAGVIVYLGPRRLPRRAGNQLSFLDCLYYATVSLSTTGYGDITPFTPVGAADQRPGDHAAARRIPRSC